MPKHLLGAGVAKGAARYLQLRYPSRQHRKHQSSQHRHQQVESDLNIISTTQRNRVDCALTIDASLEGLPARLAAEVAYPCFLVDLHGD